MQSMIAQQRKRRKVKVEESEVKSMAPQSLSDAIMKDERPSTMRDDYLEFSESLTHIFEEIDNNKDAIK